MAPLPPPNLFVANSSGRKTKSHCWPMLRVFEAIGIPLGGTAVPLAHWRWQAAQLPVPEGMPLGARPPGAAGEQEGIWRATTLDEFQGSAQKPKVFAQRHHAQE